MRVQTVGPPPTDTTVLIRMQEQKRERMKEAFVRLAQCGAVLEGGHFWFGSGKEEKHGRVYVNAHLMFNLAFVSKWFIPALADAIPRDIREQTDIVAGPPTCGILIARDLADFLSSQKDEGQPDVEAMFFRRDWDDVYKLSETDQRRLREAARPPRVLLVDDVRHTGRTFEACRDAIVDAGGQVLATAELVDRGLPTLPLGIDNYFVGQVDRDTLYKPADCPMCNAGIPITEF